MGGSIQEQLRPPRIVRVAIIQNTIVLPTTEPIRDQRDAIHKKIAKYVEHAAACGANIVCLQEGWREYIAISFFNPCLLFIFVFGRVEFWRLLVWFLFPSRYLFMILRIKMNLVSLIYSGYVHLPLLPSYVSSFFLYNGLVLFINYSLKFNN